MSTYITALCAGPYHEVRDTHDGIDLGVFVRAVDEAVPRRRRPVPDHQAGLRLLPRPVRGALPAAQVRPAVGARLQRRRDGELRLRHARRVALHLPLAGHRLRVRAARQHDPARDGAHVVRRPGHHALVERPVAQRVVRRVGQPLVQHAAPPGSPTRGRRSCRSARTGATGRTSSPPPTRSTARCPTWRRSRSTSTASRTPRARRVIKQLVAYVGSTRFVAGLRAYFAAHAWGNATFDDLLTELEKASGRRAAQVRRAVAGDRPGQHAAARGRRSAPTARTPAVGRACRRRRPSTRRCARTGSASASTTCKGDSLVRRRAARGRRHRRAHRAAALAGVRAADVLLLNDDDLTYAKLRLDERSMATVVQHIAGFESSLAAGAVLGRGLGHGPRRRAGRPRLRRAGLRRSAGRDATSTWSPRRCGRRSARSRQYADPAWAPTGWALLADTARAALAAAEPGSGFQLAWARAFIAAARRRRGPGRAARLARRRRRAGGPDHRHRAALVAAGGAGRATARPAAAEIDAELDRDRTASGEREAALARALLPTAGEQGRGLAPAHRRREAAELAAPLAAAGLPAPGAGRR